MVQLRLRWQHFYSIYHLHCDLSRDSIQIGILQVDWLNVFEFVCWLGFFRTREIRASLWIILS